MKLTLIALRTVKYNDRHNILTGYSRECGRVGLLVPAGASREARRRRALLMPLSVAEVVATSPRGGDLLGIADISPVMPQASLTSHPVKALTALFIAEFLGIVLKERQGDDALFAYLVDSIASLEHITAAEDIASFHIAFLMRLARYLGVEPDYSTYREGRVFDIVDGVFRDTPPAHGRFIPASEASALASLSRITPFTAGVYKLSRAQRNTITDMILAYYSIHHAPCSSLTSLGVLRAL